jgi:hypothetical protein
MMQISSTFSAPPLLSPRTADYVSALIREGDKFDYYRWVQQVRREEAQAAQVLTAITCREVVAAKVDDPINTSDSRDTRPSLGLAPIIKPALSPRALRWLHRLAKSKVRKARLVRWLEKIRDAWDVFQASRARDAVYGYLEVVFATIKHYKVRRRTKKLLRQAFKFADLPFDKKADPFSAIIRCTSDNKPDTKTISKWARALRYVARCKVPAKQLKTFMKEAGGVNACANGHSRCLERCAR